MIRENIKKLRSGISAVCFAEGAQAHPLPVIVAVSKGRTPEEIEEAVEAGITDIGENRVREAIVKFDHLRRLTAEKNVRWHMVGHLQTNKAKEAVKIFDLIQSLDSLHLAEEIDRQAARISKVQDVLAQVNVSAEAGKFGFEPKNTLEAVKEISRLKNIRIKGLMAIAPVVRDPQEARPYFKRLRELRDEIFERNDFSPANHERRITNGEPPVLSMGMSGDFEAAVKEGSNMIRIGRAIFNHTHQG